MGGAGRSWRLVLLTALVLGSGGPVAARTTVTAEQIDNFLRDSGSPMAGEGAHYVRWGQHWNVDPRVLVAISGAESSFGKDTQGTFNAWGWMYGGSFWRGFEPGIDADAGAVYMETGWEDGIYWLSNQIVLYRQRGLTTVAQIAPVYCTSGCQNWLPNVLAFMAEMGADVSDLTWPGSSTGTGGSTSNGFDYPVSPPNAAGFNKTAGYEWLQWTGKVYHPAEDWNGNGGGDSDLNQPVYAVSNGQVVASGEYGTGWGNIIVIEHALPDGSRVWSQYAHLASIIRGAGTVSRGEQIGTIGKGHNNEYWAHLHFEIRKIEREPSAWVTGWSAAQIGNAYYEPSAFIEAHRNLGGGANSPPNQPANLREASYGLDVTFLWDDGGDPDNGPRAWRSYVVDVFDAAGGFLQSSGWLESGPTWQWRAPATGSYSWDVRASDGAVDGARSSRRSFSIPNYPPNAPTNLRETVDGLDVAFAWDDGGDLDNGPRSWRSYVVDVFDAAGGFLQSSGWIETGPAWTWHAPRPGSYLWDVRASDSALTGPTSARRAFSVANRPPRPPQLVSPALGSVTTTRQVAFTWSDGGDPDDYPWNHRDFHVIVLDAAGATVGERPFDGDASTTWSWIAPHAGIFRWRVRAGDGELPSSWTAEQSFAIQTALWLKAGLHCVGSSTGVAGTDPGVALPPGGWRVGRYDPVGGRFVIGPPGSAPAGCELVAGRALWLWLPADASLCLPGESTAALPFDLALTSGWNNLANPYDADLPWDLDAIHVLRGDTDLGVLSDPGVQQRVSPYAWIFDSPRRRYQVVAGVPMAGAVGTIPWLAGFWVAAYEDGLTLRLSPPAGALRQRVAATGGPRDWTAELVAAVGVDSAAARVGVSQRLTRSAELALPPSPLPAGPVGLAVLRDGRRLVGAIEPPRRDRWAWDLAVTAPPGSRVSLSWPGLLRQLPRSVILELVDLSTARRLTLNARSKYEVALAAGESERRLRLTARLGTLQRPQVVAFGARARRAGSVFEVTLSQPATVTLTVRGLGGGVVWTSTAAAGAAVSTMAWDGLDVQGRRVPAGVYQVELVARGEAGAVSRAVRTVVLQ